MPTAPIRRQRVSAYALIRRERAGQQEVLLTRLATRGRRPVWTLPGGGVEHGEPIRAAVRRELIEETGLAVEVGALLDVHNVHFVGASPDGRLEDFHAIQLVCAAEPVEPDQVPVVTEVDGTTDAVAWQPIALVGSPDLPVVELVTFALALKHP